MSKHKPPGPNIFLIVVTLLMLAAGTYLYIQKEAAFAKLEQRLEQKNDPEAAQKALDEKRQAIVRGINEKLIAIEKLEKKLTQSDLAKDLSEKAKKELDELNKDIKDLESDMRKISK